MIWNSVNDSKFPSVCKFALNKKLALMVAHNSILAVHIHNANCKWQLAPFSENDLMYLSTKKNITFPKGLARKLVPISIGPYQIIRDFKNQSFQLDLPQNLKQRGMHDVFYVSLLHIHIPNDDK
jgi:hypothetical protein